jgi:hypothetical protein
MQPGNNKNQEKLPFQTEEVQSFIRIWTRKFGLTPLASAILGAIGLILQVTIYLG